MTRARSDRRSLNRTYRARLHAAIATVRRTTGATFTLRDPHAASTDEGCDVSALLVKGHATLSVDLAGRLHLQFAAPFRDIDLISGQALTFEEHVAWRAALRHFGATT